MAGKLVTGLSATGNSPLTWSSPVQRVTVLDSAKMDFPRNLVISNDGVSVIRPGYQVGFAWSDLIALAIAQESNLTWPPVFTTQPTSVSVAHPTGCSFTVAVSGQETVPGSTLTIAYQWQFKVGAGAWGNVYGAQFTNTTSATMNVTDSTGLNGYQFRCAVTTVVNGTPGQTNYSSVATLSVT